MRSPALGWLSKYYEYTVAKQNGGGAEWVELFITHTASNHKTGAGEGPGTRLEKVLRHRSGLVGLNPPIRAYASIDTSA